MVNLEWKQETEGKPTRILYAGTIPVARVVFDPIHGKPWYGWVTLPSKEHGTPSKYAGKDFETVTSMVTQHVKSWFGDALGHEGKG